MSSYNTSVTENISSVSLPRISHSVRFWYFLFCNILSLGCGLIILYFLLFDRTLRRALYNHILIVLLFIGLIYELTDIPWFLRNDYYNTPWQISSTFYLFWVFLDYSIYSLQIALFAWATIERHILIFHDQWISTRKKRFFIHYLPIIVIIIYYVIYYSIVYFAKPCETSFDSFLNGGIYSPCAFSKTILGLWDLIAHQIAPTLIIMISCISLILRVIRQRARIRRSTHWRKYRKMTIQLLSISTIYMIFNAPWVLIVLTYRFGLPEYIVENALIYAKFLLYNITFLFPFLCCLSLRKLRIKVKKKLLFWRRQRRIDVVR